MSTAWNFADLFDTIAANQTDAPAVIQGQSVLTWGDFGRSADALAELLLAAGLRAQSKVVAYLYNSPEYVVTYYAAFKAGLVPANANYRYGSEELHYLFDNADAEAVVFHASFAAKLEPIRAQLPKVKAWIAVHEAGRRIPSWALDYRDVQARTPARRPLCPPWGRDEDDLMFLYTGGTTGMPKAVMWRQDDVIEMLGRGADLSRNVPPLSTLANAGARAAAAVERRIDLVACPLMHGTGIFGALRVLCLGGAVAVLPSFRFSPDELWDEVERLKVESIALVGMAFAQPMLEALEANPGRWDLSSLRVLSSSGTMWSQENKKGLLRFCPSATILDNLASSEGGYASSTSSVDDQAATAQFTIRGNAAVFTAEGCRVLPGSGERGLLAVTGRLPLGYYKDAKKSAETFRVFEGKRWSVPGDWAQVEASGAIKLLGRGSVSINTGGEKVFPEEVEEALKSHEKVRDAVVVGIPDPRFGERICAVLEPTAIGEPTLEELQEHVRGQLAHYKAPRTLVIVESVGRAPNGKVDYMSTKAFVLEALADQTSGQGRSDGSAPIAARLFEE